MEPILTCAIGLDVHRDTIVACLIRGELDANPEYETRSFSTMVQGLQELRKWVTETNCRDIAMESTGIYWQPVYDTLENCFDGDITLLVVNARNIKNVPGRKTDVKDSQWIAMLLRAGLLRGSFIPRKEIRELRQLTRYRKAIVHDVTAQKNRIDKLLQSSGFRLSAFLSDIFGASGRDIMGCLCSHGQVTRADLVRVLRTKTRHKINDILVSANGTLSDHGRKTLSMMLDHLKTLESHCASVESEIAGTVAAHTEAMNIITSIPGISVTGSSAIIAETGTDLSAFPNSHHFSSWAGLCPGNNISAGKSKSTRIAKGNPYLKSILCEVAWVIAGKRNSYLASWYWRIKQQKGAKRAIIALARKILVMIYAMLKNKTPYDDNAYEQQRQKSERKRKNRMISELTNLGYRVSLQ
jgi:transposase